jgi:hypothetical protein
MTVFYDLLAGATVLVAGLFVLRTIALFVIG